MRGCYDRRGDPISLDTYVDGVDYSPEGIQSVRQGLIELRNGALDAASQDSRNMSWAVLLSHAIAYLADYAEQRTP